MVSKVEIKGLDELLGKMKDLQDLRGVKAGVKAAAEHVEGKAATYPPRNRPSRKSVYGRTFESDAQRRFFFAALKSGAIEVPYRRGQSPGSETHGRRWTTQIRDNGLRAVVGNNSSYGPLLQDEPRQSRYHKAVGWKTIQDVVRDETKTVLDIISFALNKDIKA